MLCVCTRRVCVRLPYWSAKQCDWLSHARPAPFPFPLFLLSEWRILILQFVHFQWVFLPDISKTRCLIHSPWVFIIMFCVHKTNPFLRNLILNIRSLYICTYVQQSMFCLHKTNHFLRNLILNIRLLYICTYVQQSMFCLHKTNPFLQNFVSISKNINNEVIWRKPK